MTAEEKIMEIRRAKLELLTHERVDKCVCVNALDVCECGHYEESARLQQKIDELVEAL